MDAIRPLLSRPTRPSVTPRSARASMGLTSDHSPSAFRSRTATSGPVTASESTASRVMSRIDLSRRSNVVWSKGRVEEAGDEDDAVRAGDGGVEVVAGGAALADEQAYIVAGRGGEADLDGRRGQSERLQVRRVFGLGDDALHLEVGEARRQRHDLGYVDVDGERLDDAPAVAVLVDGGAVAVGRRHRQRVDVVRLDVEHRLQRVRRPRRRAGLEEVDVGAQPEGRHQQDQRRAHSAHVVPPRVSVAAGRLAAHGHAPAGSSMSRLSAGSSRCRPRPPGWRRAAAAPRARRGGAARPR